MGGGVGSGGAVPLARSDRALLGAHGIVGIGQVDEVVFHEGAVALAVFKVSRCWAHIKIAPPQCPQIQMDAALHIDQERALALVLQHRQRFFGCESKVTHLGFVVRAVRVCAPVGPTAQAAQGELP